MNGSDDPFIATRRSLRHWFFVVIGFDQLIHALTPGARIVRIYENGSWLEDSASGQRQHCWHPDYEGRRPDGLAADGKGDTGISLHVR